MPGTDGAVATKCSDTEPCPAKANEPTQVSVSPSTCGSALVRPLEVPGRYAKPPGSCTETLRATAVWLFRFVSVAE